MKDNLINLSPLASANSPTSVFVNDRRGIKRFFRPRRPIIIFLLATLLIIIGTVGWLGYRALAAFNQISDSSKDTGTSGLWQFLNQQKDAQLKGEPDDRINVLFLGMGGAGHPGGQLTDTIMLASFQPKQGRIALISLPRDLYVPISNHGWGKLNSAHATGEQDKTGDGPILAEKTLSDLIGLPIHYYIRIDFSGFVKLVDALGGLDINVDHAINDPYFPDAKLEGYEPFYLKAGPTHLTGAIALKYARSRETTSDFDRSRRQQQILSAIKAKGLSVDVFLNPKKMSEILQILGSHVRTDLSAWEMERFLTLGKSVDLDHIRNKVFDTAAGSPLTSRTDESAGYIIVPRSGNFAQLRSEIANIFGGLKDDTAATIAIENASGNANLGGNVALLLRGYGYQVTSVTTAKSIRVSSRLLATSQTAYPTLRGFFKERFGTIPEASSSLLTDFVLVIGKDYAG